MTPLTSWDGLRGRQWTHPPHEIRFDGSGNLYIVERDSHVVRRVDARTNVITTVAGTGTPGYAGDGGPAAKAQLNRPHSIAFDASGDLLICDIGNHCVRAVSMKTGRIRTFGPRSSDTDRNGDLYLVLREGNAVFRLNAAREPLDENRRDRRERLSGDEGMSRRGLGILLTALLWAARPASYQSPDIAAMEALAAQPEQFADPQVRLKIFRALEGPSAEVVAAAVDIVMSSPDLAADPQLWRRFNAALSNAAPDRRKAILDRAAKKGPVTDIRAIAVIVEGLTDADSALRSAALAIVKSQPALQKNPAVAEALGRAGEAVTAVVLPAFDVFTTRVQPVLETIGPGNKRCSNCHEAHSVLRLPPMEASPAPDEVLQIRYRAALRVVDLEAPERSLILRKPTSPKGEAAFTHGGDVRFEPGSPSYQAILGWIKTGAIRR